MNAGMDFGLDFYAESLASDIEKTYGHFGTNIKVESWSVRNGRIIFPLKIKKGSRKKQLLEYAEDVQRKLELPVFIIEERKYKIYLIVSKQEIKYPHLPTVLQSLNTSAQACQKVLPCVVGYNSMGGIVPVDLMDAPHFLMGGASNSGKTTGLQALIASIAYLKPPSEVSFVMIDIGADGLFPYNDIPHLACPVITERDSACRTLAAILVETKRRKELKRDSPSKFQELPRIVVIIDELPELVRVGDKSTSTFLVDSINSLLERGRHTKIHIVLAAQNPTQRNIKVDLSNATARCAFKCAKRNNADTIIEGCGAENLPGDGAMYFSFPRLGLQRLQGVNITPEELPKVVEKICSRWRYYGANNSWLTISGNTLQCDSPEMVAPPTYIYEELYAKALYFTLGQERISAQQLCKQLHVGWPRAAELIEDFCKWRIVSTADAKLPRHVLPQRLEDVPEGLLSRLENCGITRNEIQAAIEQRGYEHNGFGR